MSVVEDKQRWKRRLDKLTVILESAFVGLIIPVSKMEDITKKEALVFSVARSVASGLVGMALLSFGEHFVSRTFLGYSLVAAGDGLNRARGIDAK